MLITKFDGGYEDYNNKIEELITGNNFTKLQHDIASKQQQHIRSELNKCKKIINTSNKWKYTNINPKAPQVHGTLKLHKHNKPKHPIVNWKGSPGYKLCKYLYTLLNNTLTLPNTFNVQNSHSITQSLQDIEIDENTKLCSFYIENMYTNIPTPELKDIIKDIIDQNCSMGNVEKDELLNSLNLILEQNYFQFKN
jgi:hypothetical protein